MSYSGGAPYATIIKGRRYNEKAQILNNTEDRLINMPYTKREYPMYREHKKIVDAPCACCFQSHGRMYQLRGTGKKSKEKAKGMKRMHKYENDFNLVC
jgi:hypothetical protein